MTEVMPVATTVEQPFISNEVDDAVRKMTDGMIELLHPERCDQHMIHGIAVDAQNRSIAEVAHPTNGRICHPRVSKDGQYLWW